MTDEVDTATQVTTGAGPAPAKYLERGTGIGRYIVLDRLGEGGMGIVYRAFDPELDRTVALKLLHQQSKLGASLGDSSWLLREAQALARLSHPNVVIVHDVGVFGADQVFIAMELVDGVTLREWLQTATRSWREVTRVMLAAGAGLAAAHAAKLVHRDFKPENVIVGKDGRVRVMDFGLARHRHGDSDPPREGDREIAKKSPLTEQTLAEGVIGTPAYMAPELFDGVAAGARTDQFSFGVVLFEALAGARPYAKELVPTRSTPRPEMPASAKVPARVAAVALRAIAVDPAERYASMDALLAELAIDPTLRRKRVAFVAGGLAAIALAVGATIALSPSSPQVCKGIDHRVAGVWDAATKQKLRDAYVATKLPFAEKAFDALVPALDRYAADWVAMATESCTATRVRRDQTEEVLSLRQTCLDSRLQELAALTKALADPNQIVVEKAAGVAAELEPLAPCADVTTLREPGTPPADVAPRLPELRGLLAEAKAQTIAARPLPAHVAATKAAELAHATKYAPAIAEAGAFLGGMQVADGNNEEAVATLVDATWAAEAAHRDDLVVRTAIGLANLLAGPLAKPAEARIWLGLGTAAARRTHTESQFESDRFKVEAVLAIDAGNLPAAVTAAERAFAATERQYGRDSYVLFGHEMLFAATLARAFEYGRAAPHFEHAIAVREQIVSEATPEIALALSNLAVCYHHMGATEKARATFEHVLALREKMFGAQSPIIVPTLDNFGVFLKDQGDLARALALLDRAVALATLMPGKEAYDYHVVATDRADVLVAQGKLAEARAAFDEVLELEARAKSTALPTTQTSRAELALAERDWATAARFADDAIAGFEAAGGQSNPELWRPLSALGRARIGLHAADARPPLERAIAIGDRVHLTDRELAATRAALAQLAR